MPPTNERITRTQFKALAAAWLGWMFDGLDGYLYVLVAGPFVMRLLGKQTADSEVAYKGAVIQAAFLVGWAVGGAVFGRIGDRLGRARTLTLTILTYAVFTGLCAVSQTWWHLLVFRFVAALGIGGEWAAGSALVSEVLHRKHRAWASATLQSGYMCGMLAASLTTDLMKSMDPRWVFIVGVTPALLTLWIRRAIPEPAEWHAAAANQAMPRVATLFAPGLRRTTILMVCLTSIALTTVWGFLYFAPQAVRAMADVKGWEKPRVDRLVAQVSTTYIIVNIVANFAATYLARFAGYRAAFFVFFGGAAVTFLVAFASAPTLGTVTLATSVAAFFGLGLFGLFPLYIPPLFPTLVRTLGAGFTYNIGRLCAAVGTFYGGLISAKVGPASAIWWLGFLYVPGLLVAVLIPELKDRERDEAAGTL